MGKRLAAHFSAWVNTDESHLVPTAAGLVPQPVQVFVEAGGELPDNLAAGEAKRLDALGGFTPLPPLAERVAAQGARLQDAAPEGEASTKPGLNLPDIDEDDLPPPLPDGTVDQAGRVSADLAHNTASQGEAVQPGLTDEERFAAAQDQAQAEGGDQQASARRASAAKKSAK